ADVPDADVVPACEACQTIKERVIDVHVDAKLAGLARHFLEIGLGQSAEICALHQADEATEESFELGGPSFGRKRIERAGRAIGIERRVLVLEIFEPFVVFEMECRRDELGKAAELIGSLA